MKRTFTLLPVFSLLAACTVVGPNHRVPDDAAIRSPAASAPFIGVDGSATSIAPLPPRWWSLYDDPQLDGLVRQALSANTDLRVASAHLRRALAQRDEVDALAGPHAVASASARRAQSAGESYLLPRKLAAANLADLGVQVSYQVDLFGRIARSEEAADANVGAGQAALESARITVVAETVAAYVQLCAATHEQAVGERVLALQQRSVALVQRLADAGRGPVTDVTRAQAQAETLRAALPLLEAERSAARYRLAALLGEMPRDFDARGVDCAQVPQLRAPVPAGDGAALLARRPDVRQMERQLAFASAKIGVATAALYPDISIGASVGFTGLLDHLGQGRTTRWGLGPLISWSIPDSGARARVVQAEADAEAALARFDGVVINAIRETETALARYVRALESQAALRAARDAADTARQQQARLYAAGRTPYIASLDAERTLADAEARLAHSESAVAKEQVGLFLALGGGWEMAVTDGDHR